MQYTADSMEVVQQLPRGDLCEQGFLVLQFVDPHFVDYVEDQHACFELCLGVQLVVIYVCLPRDLFFSNDGKFVVVCDCRVVYCRSCGDMEIQVSLVSCLVFSRQPDEADKIVVPVFLIARSEEEDGGDDGSDLDQVGVGWLAVFDLEVFLCCFEEREKFFRRHGVGSGLSALS